MLEINLKNRAITQTTVAFNSMCKVGDTYLGASADGLFSMCGASDDAVEIPALIRSGMFDLGTEKMNRFRFFYFGLECDGALKLTLHCDGVEAASYTVSKTTGVQEIRVPVSRAAQGRYWQWQIENIDGSFFALYSVKALPIILNR